MTEQEFQSRVIGSLARIEEKLTNVCQDTEGHHKTLYGEDGRGGLVKDVELNKARQNVWNRLLALGGLALTAFGAWLKWGAK